MLWIPELDFIRVENMLHPPGNSHKHLARDPDAECDQADCQPADKLTSAGVLEYLSSVCELLLLSYGKLIHADIKILHKVLWEASLIVASKNFASNEERSKFSDAVYRKVRAMIEIKSEFDDNALQKNTYYSEIALIQHEETRPFNQANLIYWQPFLRKSAPGLQSTLALQSTPFLPQISKGLALQVLPHSAMSIAKSWIKEHGDVMFKLEMEVPWALMRLSFITWPSNTHILGGRIGALSSNLMDDMDPEDHDERIRAKRWVEKTFMLATTYTPFTDILHYRQRRARDTTINKDLGLWYFGHQAQGIIGPVQALRFISKAAGADINLEVSPTLFNP